MKMTLEDRYEIAGRLYKMQTIITEAVFDFRNGDASLQRVKDGLENSLKIVEEIENDYEDGKEL